MVLLLVVLVVVMVVLVMAVVKMMVVVAMTYSNSEWIPSVGQVLCHTFQVMTQADLTLTLSSVHIGLLCRLYRSFVPASEPDLCHTLCLLVTMHWNRRACTRAGHTQGRVLFW